MIPAPRAGRAPLPLPMLAAAALGAVASFGLAPAGVWPLTLLALALLPAVMDRAGGIWRRGFAIAWAFGAGYFGLGLSWIVEPFQIDPDRHAWMAPFALVFLACGLALFWGGAGALAVRLGGGGLRRAAQFAVLLAAAETLRATVLTGFPWAARARSGSARRWRRFWPGSGRAAWIC